MAQLSIDDFLSSAPSQEVPVIDVRSPGEFSQGHIPGAFNLPLFNNEERAEIGTLYKQQGREVAIERGLELVGPKMIQFVRLAKKWAPHQRLRVHCWRGGMRSGSMAWLLRTAGLAVDTLEGGYKAYRRKVLQDLTQPLRLVILGGKTGSGKTDLLHTLAEMGEQVVDLEGLAHHKGSAFGALGQPEQPSSEQFANLLHAQIQSMDLHRPIWVEDESHSIGRVHIPEPFWAQMKSALVVAIDVPLEWRVDRLVADYGQADPALLAQSFQRIRKRLGGQNLKEALAALEKNDLATAARIGLSYYDRAYQHALEQRNPAKVHTLSFDSSDLMTQAKTLIQFSSHDSQPKA